MPASRSKPKQTKAWKSWLDTLKAQTKSERSARDTLKKIIDDYCSSGKFDDYLQAHAEDAVMYLRQERGKRARYRASAAGKCMQQQAFNAVDVALESAKQPRLLRTRYSRPATQYRALQNGTFAHARWHLIFDALHEEGVVRTLYAETFRFNEELNLDGHIDRVIEFEFNDVTIRAIIDFKTIKAQYWELLVKPQSDHELQQHAYYMFEYDAPVWIMLYENKNTHELKVYEAEYSELMLQRLKRNYREMNEWIEKYLYDPEAARPNLPLIVTWCRYCPWQKLCADEHPDLAEQQSRIGEEPEDTE